MDENNKIISFIKENNESTTPVPPSLQQYATGAPALGYSMWTILEALQKWLDVTAGEAMLAIAQLAATTSELSLDASNNQTTMLNYDNEQIQNATDSDTIQQDQSKFATDQTAFQVPMTVLQGLSQLLSQLQTTVAQAMSLVGNTAASMINTVRSYGTGT